MSLDNDVDVDVCVCVSSLLFGIQWKVNNCYTFLPTYPTLVTELNNVTPKLACTRSLIKKSGGQQKVLCPETVECSVPKQNLLSLPECRPGRAASLRGASDR